MKIKVLFLFVHLDYGGAEVGLLTTLKNIDKSRFDCSVVSIEKKGRIAEEIEKLGFKVTCLDSKARLFNISLIRKIALILEKEKPDILHTSLFYANFFGRAASLFCNPRFIVTEERSMYTEKKFYHVILDRILAGFTDRIIVCSRSVLDFTRKQEGIAEDKFYLIYNAVDAERFNIPGTKEALRKKYGFSGEDFIVGTVGSLIPKKGHRFLIEAVKGLDGQIPRLKTLIIGEGESRAELTALARSLGIENKVVFLGARFDIPGLMKAMDVFVLPSLQEGFPRTLIEAMYTGLPVVASDISGIPEIVREGEDGFLVPPGDPEALKNRILELYNDKPLRGDFAARSRKKIESAYLPKDYVQSLEGLYRELTERRGGPQ